MALLGITVVGQEVLVHPLQSVVVVNVRSGLDFGEVQLHVLALLGDLFLPRDLGLAGHADDAVGARGDGLLAHPVELLMLAHLQQLYQLLQAPRELGRPLAHQVVLVHSLPAVRRGKLLVVVEQEGGEVDCHDGLVDEGAVLLQGKRVTVQVWKFAYVCDISVSMGICVRRVCVCAHGPPHSVPPAPARCATPS